LSSFDIGRFLVCPKRKLYGVLLRGEAKPNVLRELASMLAEENVITRYLSFSRPVEVGQPVTVLAFLDFTETKARIEDLVERAKNIDFVEEIKVIEPKVKGFIADTVSNPLKIGESRAILLRDIGTKGFVVDLRKRLGSAAEAILYYLGFEAGLEFGKSHKQIGKKLGIQDNVQIFKDISASMFICVGYGIMEVIRLEENPPKGRIRVYNCFECELGKGSGKPYSHLVRGMTAGVLTKLFGKTVAVREVKCIAKGDSYCEYEITTEEKP